jgi:hypothetical protein
MNSGWTESSHSEIALARATAEFLYSECTTVDRICAALEDLASELASIGSRGASATDVRLTTRLLSALPELWDINLEEAFPNADTDLTANFFGRLAHEVGVCFDSPVELGMFGTPPILALDMVALAITLRVGRHIGRPEDLWSAFFDNGMMPPAQRRQAISALRGVGWYDPCVGGGVFPVSILVTLNRLGVKLDRELLSNIWGNDLSPFSATASSIRVALLVSSLEKIPYATVRSHLPAMFTVGDSLRYYTEQASIERPDLGAGRGAADIVIGNPPYVRADRIGPDAKTLLRHSYPSVAGGSVDLYSYFIAHGLMALREGGVLCYVSPASFQKSKYGENTRKFVNRRGAVRALFDFHELPVFSAGVHTSVYAIEKGRSRAGCYPSKKTHWYRGRAGRLSALARRE